METMTCAALPPTDPPSAKDVNVVYSSRLEAAGDAYVLKSWTTINDRKSSEGWQRATHVRKKYGVGGTGNKCRGRATMDRG